MGESPRVASRMAWTFTHGDPGELCVLHRCDNPPCCNPAHLFLGTKADNSADMVSKGREKFTDAKNINALVERVRRLTDDDIRAARDAHDKGESFRSIARRLGVAHTTISRLIKGEHWQQRPTS